MSGMVNKNNIFTIADDGNDKGLYASAPEEPADYTPPEKQCTILTTQPGYGVFPEDDLEYLRSDVACAIFPTDKSQMQVAFPLPKKCAAYPGDDAPPSYENTERDLPPTIQNDCWVEPEKISFFSRFRKRKRQSNNTGLTNEANKDNPGSLVSWRHIFYDYSQNTTFHGPRLIFEKQPFFIRRVLWAMLFLMCMSIFTLQVVTNVQHYLTWPVTVDVKINYNDSIIFPAITLCNANSFRTTKASEHDLYNLINDLYGPDSDRLNMSKYDVTGVSLLDLYMKTSHDKQDFIVSCLWDENQCSHNDFVPTVTDFGLCYTFNSGRNDTRLKRVYQTGAQGGLRLQLNIEQYEYMRGPNEGAGLKILLHHPNDVPMVSDHGSAMSPGTHGLVAVKIVQVNNLEPNYGKCNDSVELNYYDRYSMAACYTDCKERHIVHKCGCRDIYMKTKDGEPAVCDVIEFQSCMKQALETFYQVRRSCSCPIPCDQPLYQPSVSYTTTSNFDIENLLRESSTGILQDKYVTAREKTERVDQGMVEANTDLINGFISVVDILDKAFKSMHEGVGKALDSLQLSNSKLMHRVNFHNDQALKKVKQMLESNFLRAHKMYSERAFHYVTLDFYGMPNQLKRVIQTAKSKVKNLTSSDTRWQIYFPMMNVVSERRTLMSRSLYYIKRVNTAFTKGTPLLTYSISYKKRYDKSYISLPLLQTGAVDQLYYYNRIIIAINQMNYGAYKLQKLGEKFAESGSYDSSLYSLGYKYYTSGASGFNYGLHWFEKLSVFKALDVIKERIATFAVYNRTVNEKHVSITWKLNEIKEIIETTIQSDWQALVNLFQLSSEYLNQNGSKTHLADEVTSTRIEKAISMLTFVFEDISLKMKDLKNALNELKVAYIDVWSYMLDEIHTKPLYKHIYDDCQDFLNTSSQTNYSTIFGKLLGKSSSEIKAMDPQDIVLMLNGDFNVTNMTQVLINVESEFSHLTNTLEMAVHIGNSQDKFMAYFKHYKDTLSTFLQNNNIDTKFYRENFMTLDVFLQELSYEEITQQKAYDVAMLLSDFGGLMGLFVGGSVVTIFELIDLFLHQSCKMLVFKKMA